MTAPARITQAEIDRAVKAVAGKVDRARIVMDLAKQRIEIIIGDPPASESGDAQEWPDDD